MALHRISWPLHLLLASLSIGMFPGMAAQDFQLRARVRRPHLENTHVWKAETNAYSWIPNHTAFVVCDMWDRHWCPDATARVGEMAPRMNDVLRAARDRGALIIHCPSETMNFYRDHPARLRAQSAPKVETTIPLQRWCHLQSDREPALPIDASDEGCDGCPDCAPHEAWKRQHPALEISDQDAITDSAEAFYLMRQRGITNVVVMGVHANMCVLGRPFSIRQLVAQGQNIVLMRDMTDAMYHHRRWPFVSHTRGTELIVEHIEKYWCPSITSVDLLGGEPFRFAEERRPHLVFVVGENEYRTWETLPKFVDDQLSWGGYRISWVKSSPKEGDSDFQGVEAIDSADLLVISVRRRIPSSTMLTALRRHVSSGKPVLGLRTASHAFASRVQGEETLGWPDFDVEVLGGKYEGHYSNVAPQGPPTKVTLDPNQSQHPILRGVSPFTSSSHLYKFPRLKATATPVLWGSFVGQTNIEPVVWMNESGEMGRHRAMALALGDPGDFANPSFQRLLWNGIRWCLREYIPTESLSSPTSKPSASYPKVEATAETSVPNSSPRTTTTISLDRSQSALSPNEAKERFRVADGWEWDQVLSEPEISQPVFLNFDERGRMWVVEFRQYPEPAGLKVVSHDQFWRAVYDTQPAAPPNHVRGADRISIHEDRDGDGVWESHKTFLDGLNIVTAVERGRGGVWVLNPSYLLFYPDLDSNDVPDSDPEIRLSGFGLEDTHSVVNSLRWGPDGWLYAAQGSTVSAQVLVYGKDGRPISDRPIFSQGQLIWRYQPEERRYEIFAEGGGNAFGCEMNSQGRIFSGHNGGDTRGFHYVQGAYLQKGFEKHGPLSNPYSFGYFPPMAHNVVERFTHNFVILEGNQWSEALDGKLLGIEPLQGRLVLSELTPIGSTFRTLDVNHPVESTDSWFRPVDIKLGPDGGIYVADWYDRQIAHSQSYQTPVDRERGRIYRLGRKESGRSHESSASRPPISWEQKLESPNKWERQTAQRILADREDVTAGDQWMSRLAELRDQSALEYFWAAANAFRRDLDRLEDLLRLGLGHPEAAIREWAVRLLGDREDPNPWIDALGPILVRMAQDEKSILVRQQLAATAKRLRGEPSLRIVEELLAHAEDSTDPRQPLMIWWTIESKLTENSEEVVKWILERGLWKLPLMQRDLAERISRRLALGGSRQPDGDDWNQLSRLFSGISDHAMSQPFLRGAAIAFQSSGRIKIPEMLMRAWIDRPVDRVFLDAHSDVAGARKRLLEIAVDESEPTGRRHRALGLLAESVIPTESTKLLEVFKGAVQDDEIRVDALAALGRHTGNEIADQVLLCYPRLKMLPRASAETMLASRSGWSDQFLKKMEMRWSNWSGPLIPPTQVAKTTIGLLAAGEHRDRALRLWPEAAVKKSASASVKRISESVRSGEGNPFHGRQIFNDRCAQCHRLFGAGNDVGPDLTAYQRQDLEALIRNIVDPNQEIREGYAGVQLSLKDGMTFIGVLIQDSQDQVIVKSLDQRLQTFRRSDLEETRKLPGSIMPEDLMEGLEDRSIRDLFAYLRSTQPLVGNGP